MLPKASRNAHNHGASSPPPPRRWATSPCNGCRPDSTLASRPSNPLWAILRRRRRSFTAALRAARHGAPPKASHSVGRSSAAARVVIAIAAILQSSLAPPSSRRCGLSNDVAPAARVHAKRRRCNLVHRAAAAARPTSPAEGGPPPPSPRAHDVSVQYTWTRPCLLRNPTHPFAQILRRVHAKNGPGAHNRLRRSIHHPIATAGTRPPNSMDYARGYRGSANFGYCTLWGGALPGKVPPAATPP